MLTPFKPALSVSAGLMVSVGEGHYIQNPPWGSEQILVFLRCSSRQSGLSIHPVVDAFEVWPQTGRHW